MARYGWIVLDVIAVVMLIAVVNYSARIGFVRAIVELISCVVAVCAARTFSPRLGVWLYKWFGRDLTRRVLETQIEKSGIMEGFEKVLDSLDGLLGALFRYGGDMPDMEVLPHTAREAAEVLVDRVLEQPVTALLQTISFMMIFSLVLFLLQRFSRLLNFIRYIPFVGSFNALLGGIMGVGQGIFYLLLFAVALYLAVMVSGGDSVWLNEDMIEQTFIVSFFYRLFTGGS